MEAKRVFTRIRVPVSTLHPIWEEVSFHELTTGDIIKIIDYDDNGKISVDGMDGSKILLIREGPHKYNDNIVIETDEVEGKEEDIMEMLKE